MSSWCVKAFGNSVGEASTVDWPQVEARLGTALPQDYKGPRLGPSEMSLSLFPIAGGLPLGVRRRPRPLLLADRRLAGGLDGRSGGRLSVLGVRRWLRRFLGNLAAGGIQTPVIPEGFPGDDYKVERA